MIIPIKCFTCGKVLADKYNYYIKRCKELEKEQEKQKKEGEQTETEKLDMNTQHYDKTVRQKVFEELGLDKICCRRMLLGHVDLIDII
jgi:DNA-directed RNA polymerase subunit N (RpoN/RPB10)